MSPVSKSSSPTIRDVARLAGVSVATVSRYITGVTPVADETAARLEQAMAALQYVPQAAARRLATHKTNTIGLLLDSIQGDFFTPLLAGIEAIAGQAGYDLLISTAARPGAASGLALPLGKQNTDGLLVFANTLNEVDLRRCVESGLPLILIHQSPPPGLEIPCVTVENKAAACKLVDHLIEVHGRRRIVFLRGAPGQEDSIWRESGYRQSLQAHGLALDESLIGQGNFERQAAQQALLAMLAEGVNFDAVFSGDDEAAVGVLSALRSAGKPVPAEVSVVGFDDQRLSAFLSPPLTTVRAPTEEVGRAAARQLLRLLQQGQAEALTLLPTDLILRRSCGCDRD